MDHLHILPNLSYGTICAEKSPCLLIDHFVNVKSVLNVHEMYVFVFDDKNNTLWSCSTGSHCEQVYLYRHTDMTHAAVLQVVHSLIYLAMAMTNSRQPKAHSF